MINKLVYKSNNRNNWIDALRFWACIWVCFVHLSAAGFLRQGFIFETNERLSFILFGITGKLAVALFCVFLGYFATASGVKEKASFGKYCISRYIQFSFNLLVINIIFIILASILKWPINAPYGIWQTLIRDSFFYEFSLVATYWPMRDFFLTSLICFSQGYLIINKFDKYPYVLIIIQILLIIIIYKIGMVWIANGIMGSSIFLLRFIFKKKKDNKKLCVNNIVYKFINDPFVHIISIPLILYLYRRTENNVTYFYDGIACSIFVLFCFSYDKHLNRIPGIGFISLLGEYSFYIYLAHPIIQNIILPFTENLKSFLSINIAFLFSFIIEIIIVLSVSILMNFLYMKINKISKWLFI